ncbi:unnamed protein product [Somion occarium]|uniref:Uncharacterized protein n=1 Tax=Somion occarium TaxID=3059160 RepID=A0ABP1CUZ6_9APHY
MSNTKNFNRPQATTDIDSKLGVLQYVERDIDSDADEEFDEMLVGDIMRLERYGIKPMETPHELLIYIVARDRSLNRAYEDHKAAENLVNKYPALVPLLREACETKSFAKVRSLAILQPKPRDVEELWKTSNVSRIPYELGIINPEEHASLDEEISAMNIGPDSVGFLYFIIETAQGRGLNLKSMEYSQTRAYLQSHPELERIIVELRKAPKSSRSFASLRLICDFWVQLPYAETKEQIVEQAIRQAWTTQYEGNCATTLLCSMTVMNQNRGTRMYGNMLPIVQSSGMGKSRAVHEVAGSIFTLPLNVRDDSRAMFAFPRADEEVRKFLLSLGVLDASYSGVHRDMRVFLLHLFDVTRQVINAAPFVNGHYARLSDLALAWRDYLAQAVDGPQLRTCRGALYSQVIQSAQTAFEDRKKALSMFTGDALKVQIEIMDKQEVTSLIKSAEELARAVQSLVDEKNKNAIKIFLYLDEAKTLSSQDVSGEPDSNYYDALLSALADLVPVAGFFATTLSTTSSLSKHARTAEQHHSDRWMGDAKKSALLQAPYTELSFDCLPNGKPIFYPGQMTLDEIASVEYMVKFGRPLFWTQWNNATVNSTTRNNMINFARHKLTGHQAPSQRGGSRALCGNRGGNIAAISTRVLLDFEPSRQRARNMEAGLVENHMRVAFSVPIHREYVRSGTPSEPILAEAAAQHMDDSMTEDITVTEVASIFEDGIVNKGEQGELATRLLLTLAYDRAVKAHYGESHANNLYSQGVPVVKFLQELFSEDVIESILHSYPEGCPGSTLEEAFEDGWVRFTHWGRFGNDNEIDTEAALAAFARGMAIQVKPIQAVIDCVVPIVFIKNRAETKISEREVTAVLIQVKTMEKAVTLTIDADGRKKNSNPEAKVLQFFPLNCTHHRPYITILMQHAIQTAKVTARYQPLTAEQAAKRPPSPSKVLLKGRASTRHTADNTKEGVKNNTTPSEPADTLHPRYAIDVHGCSPSVYGVVTPKQTALWAQLLAARGLLAEHARQQDENISVLKSLKPTWIRGPECYGYTAQPLMNISSHKPT